MENKSRTADVHCHENIFDRMKIHDCIKTVNTLIKIRFICYNLHIHDIYLQNNNL